MGMNVGSGGDDEVMVDINTTPLIDVMLVLLIIFIITLPPQTHATKIDLPQNQEDQEPPTVDPVINQIYIDFDNTLLWNSEEVSGVTLRENLAASYADGMAQAIAAGVANENDSVEQRERDALPYMPEIHIQPDQLAIYETVDKVMAMVQQQRLQKMAIVGNEAYAN